MPNQVSSALGILAAVVGGAGFHLAVSSAAAIYRQRSAKLHQLFALLVGTALAVVEGGFGVRALLELSRQAGNLTIGTVKVGVPIGCVIGVIWGGRGAARRRIYAAYDWNGTLLRLRATGVKHQLWGLMIDQSNAIITLEPAEEDAGHRGELRKLMVDRLGGLGHDRPTLEGLEWPTLRQVAREACLVRVQRSWLADWRKPQR